MASSLSVAAAGTASSSLQSHSLVGITAYLSRETKPFSAVIKHRYSDFHVREVDLLGQVVHLTDLKATAPVTAPMEATDTLVTPSEADKIDALCGTIPSLTAEQVQLLLASQIDSIDLLAPDDKVVRTSWHAAVREHFAGVLGTSARVDSDEPSPATTSKKVEKIVKGDNQIPVVQTVVKQSAGKQLQIVMIERFNPKLHSNRRGNHGNNRDKEDRDTMDCINFISRLTKVSQKEFHMAGTKDRRAIATQRISVHKLTPNRLAGLNSTMRGARVGNFVMEKQRLNLGDLRGNVFRIALRDLVGERADIEGAVGALREHGFINYFGMQRFGTHSVSTHSAGILMLKAKWKETCDLILDPRDGDSDEYVQARKMWASTRDPKQALEAFPRRCTAERALLSAYVKDPKSHLAALNSIPRNLRTMYLHAYQSRVWNEMASNRVKMGLTVLVGDTVFLPAETVTYDSIDHALTTRRDNKREVHIVTQGDVDGDRFGVYDICLAQPGYDVKYPTHALSEEYVKYMAQDGVDPQNMKREIKDFSLPGSYRALLEKPLNLTHRFKRYNFSNEDLFLSDLQALDGAVESTEEGEGDHLALLLEFELPSSTYATMAIRELTKSETSAAHQSALSVAVNEAEDCKKRKVDAVEVAGAQPEVKRAAGMEE